MKNWSEQIESLKKGEGLRAQLVRGVLGIGGLHLLSIPLNLLASVVLARALGPSGYGEYVFVLSVVTMVALPVSGAGAQLITREVAVYHQGNEWALMRGMLRRAYQWVIYGSLILVAITLAIAVMKAQWRLDDRWTLVIPAVLLIPFLGLVAIKSNALRGLRYTTLAQIPDLLIKPGAHLVIIGGLLILGVLNTVSVILSQGAAVFMAFMVAAIFLSKRLPEKVSGVKPDYRDKQWGGAMFPFTLLAAVSMLNGQIGVLVLGWLGNASDVAAMRVAMSGASYVSLSLVLVNMVLGPHIINAQKTGGRERLQTLSRQSARAGLIMALPIALPLILWGEPIVDFVYGAEYADSVVMPLAILAVGQLVNVAFGSVGLFLAMTGYEKDTLLGQVVAVAFSVLLAVVLAPGFGAVGAASAVSVGLVVWNLVLAIRLKKRLGIVPTAMG